MPNPSGGAMKRWSFTVDCPRCGGNLTHVTGSRPHPHANLETRAVATCDDCHDTYIIELTLRSELKRRTREADLERGIRRMRANEAAA